MPGAARRGEERMRNSGVFTGEGVSAGRPDRGCGRISGQVADLSPGGFRARPGLNRPIVAHPAGGGREKAGRAGIVANAIRRGTP